jgi:hypothetical protein
MLTATIRKLCPSLDFTFLLMCVSLECDTFCCSIYLIDFGAWLHFKGGLLQQSWLVSLNQFGTLL